MKLTSLLRSAILLCGVAALTASVGCKSKQAADDGIADDGIVSGGDELPFGGDDMPQTGVNFQDLNRITDVSFTPVYFGYNNYQLDGSEYGKMDQVASYLQNNSDAVLVVEGHCDERGTEEYNMSLGDFRAQSVRAYMVNAGISEDRIQTASFGKSRPAVSGSGEAVWRLNRRGEFALYRR